MSLNYSTGPEPTPLGLVPDVDFQCFFCEGKGGFELFGEFYNCVGCDGSGRVLTSNAPRAPRAPKIENQNADWDWDEAAFRESMELDRQQGLEATPWHCY